LDHLYLCVVSVRNHKKGQIGRPTPFLLPLELAPSQPPSKASTYHAERKKTLEEGREAAIYCCISCRGMGVGVNSCDSKKHRLLFFYLRTYSQTTYNSENQVFLLLAIYSRAFVWFSAQHLLLQPLGFLGNGCKLVRGQKTKSLG
jgi:hypothetical protein